MILNFTVATGSKHLVPVCLVLLLLNIIMFEQIRWRFEKCGHILLVLVHFVSTIRFYVELFDKFLFYYMQSTVMYFIAC